MHLRQWVKNLGTGKFRIGSSDYCLENPGEDMGGAMGGAEGFVLPLKSATNPAAKWQLKLYSHQERYPERIERMSALAQLELHNPSPTLPADARECFRVFEAAPAVVFGIGTRLQNPQGESIETSGGYLCRSIRGRTLKSLFEDDLPTPEVSLSLEQRLGVARTLADAIAILEECSMVHGDLARTNAMLLTDGVSGTFPREIPLRLRLIDFDGVFRSGSRGLGDKGRRMEGTPGYLHPARDRTDRFALAILSMELLLLGLPFRSTELAGQTDIDQRHVRVDQLRHQITTLAASDASGRLAAVAAWDPGWKLFEKALRSESSAQAPAPADWRDALWAIGAGSSRKRTPAYVVRVRVLGPEGVARFEWQGPLSEKGDLGAFNGGLQSIQYELTPDGVSVSGIVREAMLFHADTNGKTKKGYPVGRAIRLTLAPAEKLCWGDLELTFISDPSRNFQSPS
jgi:hypothetical protein